MKAINIFRKLMETVYCQTVFLKRREKKPGELISKLPPEEREILSNLKSDDLSGERFDPEAKLFAYDDYHERHRDNIMISEEKLKFDKLIHK